MAELSADNSARQGWMGLLARAPAARLKGLLPELPPHDVVRQPEVGAVMLRGRTGATGAPFNLGEMTVTRCTVRLASGEVGHGYVQGRDKDHALRAAVIDARMQGNEAAEVQPVLEELRRLETERQALRARKAAATKVEFFTLVRGED